MTANLISPATKDAYKKRLERMSKLKFTEKGDLEFIEQLVAISSQVENLHVKANINDFEIESDEPESLGGFNRAPRPIDLFLAALANCLEVAALLYFGFSGLAIRNVKVEVRAKIDKRSVLKIKDAPLPGLYDINWIWHVESDEKLKKIQKVISMVEKNCPVKGTLTRNHDFYSEIILKP